ncbi:MAG: hypothetical protein WKF59_17180 [Chitinophagaceae bacterium]
MPPSTAIPAKDVNPLQSIEQWEDDVLIRYPEAGEKGKRRIPKL